MTPNSYIDDVNIDLLSKAESLLPQWFPGGKWDELRYGIPYEASYTRKDGTKGNIMIFTQRALAGIWYDKEAQISGAGLLKLYAYKEHMPGWNTAPIQTMNEAAKQLGYNSAVA